MSIHMELKDDRSETVQYDSPDYPIYIRRAYLSGYPDYAAPIHWHDDIELILLLDGEMTYNVNGVLTDMKCGEGIFVNSRQLHFGYSPDRKECVFICILLHPMLLCAVSETEREYVLPVIRDAARPYIHLSPSVPWQKEVLADIAASGHVGQSKCCKLFARYFSKSPMQYLNHYRLNKSIGLLRDTDLSVAEIALEVGFGGGSYYTETFRKHFGETPSEYRSAKKCGPTGR